MSSWSSIAGQGVPESASAPGASVAAPKPKKATPAKIEERPSEPKEAKKEKQPKRAPKEQRAKEPRPPSAAEVALQADIDGAGEEIAALKHELDALAGQLKIRDKVRGDVAKECKAIKDQLREVGGRRHKLIEAKKALVAQVRLARENRRTRDEQLKEARKVLEQTLKVKQVSPSLEANLATVDELVHRLESALETSSLSIQEEKKRVAEINNLRKTKEDVRQYHALVERLTGATDTKAISARISELDAQIDGDIKTRETELNAELSKWRAKLDHKSADVPTLYAKRRELYAKLDKAHKAKQAATKALRDKRHQLYQKRQEARQKREEEQKKWIEEKKAETKRRDEERAAAKLLIVPFADEMVLCDQLIQYLTPLGPAAAAGAKGGAKAASAGADNRLLKEAAKDAGDKKVTVLTSKKNTGASSFMSAAQAKRNKSTKSQKARQNNRPKKLQHHMDTVADFASLKLTPPSVSTQVPAILKSLAEKKADFAKRSAAKQAERKAALEAKQAAAAANQEEPASVGDADDNDLLAAFRAADKDNSGKLSKEEFTAVLSAMSQFDSQEKIDAALAKADVDGDGQIAFAEFCGLAESTN